jgi:hypothetical protein
MKYIKKPLVTLAIISLFLFSLKWLLSFYYFPEEEITMRIINDSHEDSYLYFHYIKSLADFDFNNIYNTTSLENNFKVLPLGAIFIHTVFFKTFGIGSFIFLEFLSIFSFMFIFFLIFKKLKFSFEYSIFLSLISYFLPIIISGANYFEIPEIDTFVSNFYNLRFPRPLIANLFFFYFIYLLIKFNFETSLKIRTLAKLAIVLGLSFSSFYFLFFTEIIAVSTVFLIKVKKGVFLIDKKNLLKLFLSSCIFIILIIPFLFLINNGSEAHLQRMGLIKIDFLDKIFFIKHYLFQLFNIKLLLVYIILIINFIYVKKNYVRDFQNISVFYIIFISSVLAPIVFLLITNKISVLYHFNNTVVLCLFLLFLMNFLIFLKNNTKAFFYIRKIYLVSFSLIILVFFNIYSFTDYNKKIINKENRIDRNKIFKILSDKNIQNKDLSLLTFNSRIMIWSILNNFKDINILDGQFSPRSHDLTDKSLIESFKFLKLEILDFQNFIKNKKRGYRYLNEDARLIYWLKYQANSSITFKDSIDFDEEVLKHIEESSPYYSHQFAIPKFEQKRLSKLFKEYDNNIFKDPDLIILNKNHYILDNAKINLEEYCTIYNQKLLRVYLKKNNC